MRPVAEAGEPVDQHRQVGPQGWLAAGEPQAGEPEALDAHPGHPLQLLEAEQVLPGQPPHPLLGHAVGAAEVAPVGHRDAQVADGAPVGVDQRLVHPAQARAGHGQRAAWIRKATSSSQHPRRDAVAVGHQRQAVGHRHGRQGVRGLAALLAHQPAGRLPPAGGAARSVATRTRWSLPSGRRGSPAGASAATTGRHSRSPVKPIRRRMPGRPNSSNDTRHETGLPGSPNTGVPATVPKAKGLAGRMATWNHRKVPPESSSSTPSRGRPRPSTPRRW